MTTDQYESSSDAADEEVVFSDRLVQGLQLLDENDAEVRTAVTQISAQLSALTEAQQEEVLKRAAEIKDRRAPVTASRIGVAANANN